LRHQIRGTRTVRILLAEHDQAVAQSIELMLTSKSFNVYTTGDGAEAVDLGKLYDYDLILLCDTPDLTGCDMLKSLRLAKVKSPIIVLSRSSNVENIVQALGIGADDYMTKPFHADELVARIHAIVRRSKGHAQSIITTGNLSVNISTKTVAVNGRQIRFTAKEYAILELLSLRKGMTISKEMLLDHLYSGRDEPEIKIIDVFICKIRKKLLDATEGETSFVETIWGRGYVLRDEAKPSVLSPSLAPEMRDLIDDPPTGFVSRKSFMEKRNEDIAAGRVKAPSIVPAQGSGK
jgi:two-component system cell cycle response regulator CtrA